ncbi:MAG: hypothetical protein WCQ44_07375 [Opitutaceae bacterium]
MKRWMMAVMLIVGAGRLQAQSADTSRQRYRGGEQTVISGAPQRTDRFIDKDGDGICDERASGLGFRRSGQGMNMNAGNGIEAGQGRGKKLQKGKKS